MLKIFIILWLSLAVMYSINASQQDRGDDLGHVTGNATEVKKRAAQLIRDPLILEGWKFIYHSDVSIDLQDGVTITAKDLASFLVSSSIPVEWGSDSICNGGSCSRLYCDGPGTCMYEDGKPGIDPIYLNVSIRGQTNGHLSRVVDDLAHEIFHRMQPFGPVKSTQLEEYLAFKIGARVSNQEWPSFGGVDPLNPTQLEHWFYAHAMIRYLQLEAYPGDIQPEGFQRITAENSLKTYSSPRNGQETRKR